MKLNLPSTLTAQRAWTLFFLTLLQFKQTEAGNAFKNCLASEDNDLISYNKLLNYTFPAGDLGSTPDYYLILCCETSQCQLGSPTSTCVNKFWCVRIGGKVACNNYSGKCNGLIDNEQITANAVDRQDNNVCVDSGINIIPSLTNNCLKTIVPTGLGKGYAYYDTTSCPSSVRGILKYCSWDNQGMICADVFKCWLQFPLEWSKVVEWSELLKQNPTNLPDNGNHSIEKIAIPVGSITGVSLTSFLTYYFCKKKKRKAKLMLENKLTSEDNNLESQDIELDKKRLTIPKLSSNFAPSEQKLEVEENQKIEQLAIANSPHSLISSQTSSISQLKTRLIGHEQLWNDYLEVNNLLITNPHSQLVLKNFYQIQQQLLQIFTAEDLTTLLENENVVQTRNPQTEYTEFIEEATPIQRINSPQSINYRNPQWRGN